MSVLKHDLKPDKPNFRPLERNELFQHTLVNHTQSLYRNVSCGRRYLQINNGIGITGSLFWNYTTLSKLLNSSIIAHSVTLTVMVKLPHSSIFNVSLYPTVVIGEFSTGDVGKKCNLLHKTIHNTIVTNLVVIKIRDSLKYKYIIIQMHHTPCIYVAFLINYQSLVTLHD